MKSSTIKPVGLWHTGGTVISASPSKIQSVNTISPLSGTHLGIKGIAVPYNGVHRGTYTVVVVVVVGVGTIGPHRKSKGEQQSLSPE